MRLIRVLTILYESQQKENKIVFIFISVVCFLQLNNAHCSTLNGDSIDYYLFIKSDFDNSYLKNVNAMISYESGINIEVEEVDSCLHFKAPINSNVQVRLTHQKFLANSKLISIPSVPEKKITDIIYLILRPPPQRLPVFFFLKKNSQAFKINQSPNEAIDNVRALLLNNPNLSIIIKSYVNVDEHCGKKKAKRRGNTVFKYLENNKIPVEKIIISDFQPYQIQEEDISSFPVGQILSNEYILSLNEKLKSEAININRRVIIVVN